MAELRAESGKTKNHRTIAKSQLLRANEGSTIITAINATDYDKVKSIILVRRLKGSVKQLKNQDECADTRSQKRTELDTTLPSQMKQEDSKKIDTLMEDGTRRRQTISSSKHNEDENYRSKKEAQAQQSTSESAKKPKTQIACPICQEVTAQYKLKRHLKAHEKCRYCDETFTSAQHRTSHAKTHLDGDRLYCAICRKHFGKPAQYRKHNFSKHTRVPVRRCKVCRKEFIVQKDLRQHLLDEHGTDFDDPKTNVCQFCGIAFHAPSSLAVHIRVHTGEKPFECMYCKKRFTQKSTLTKHERIHTNERPYVCHICGMGFNQKGMLGVHINVHTGAKPYECRFCGRGFAQSANKNNHEKVHTGSQPYKCIPCGKGYIKRTEWTAHMTRYHDGPEGHDKIYHGDNSTISPQDSAGHNLGRSPQSTNDEGRLDPLKDISLRLQVKCDDYEQIKHFIKADRSTRQSRHLYSCKECPEIYTNAKGVSEHCRQCHSKKLKKNPTSKDLSCNICDQIFETIEDLEEHRVKNHVVTTFISTGFLDKKGILRRKCHECGVLINASSYVRHMRKNHTPVQTSGISFTDRDTYRIHNDSQIGDGPHDCIQCNKTFEKPSKLVTHLLTHQKQGQHKCEICFKAFDLPKFLRRHMKIHSDKTINRKCQFCGKGFNSKYYLLAHERTHTGERPYACNECGKSFGEKSGLNRHMDIHNNVPRYGCRVCHQKFFKKSVLQSHLQNTHSIKQELKKSYVCQFCGAGCVTSANLEVHIRIHTGEKPHKCNYCERSFAQKATLINHERTHTKEKPFVCEICGAGFSQKRNMLDHKIIHSGEKPFKCDHCGRGFAQRSHRKEHEAIHTGTQRHKCGVCGKGYAKRKEWVTHMERHHGGVTKSGIKD